MLVTDRLRSRRRACHGGRLEGRNRATAWPVAQRRSGDAESSPAKASLQVPKVEAWEIN